ncbi:hypothetical protein ACET3Z_007853 [Daucus carota]
MDFKRGDVVEIMGTEEGFEGSYFEAILISKVSNNDYIVQYNTLMNDDKSGPARAFVSGKDIQPVPEEIMAEKGFSLNDRVDVYYREGWWVGKITEKLENEYRVWFEHTGDEGVYSPTHTQMRLHRDWINGKWV